YTLTTYIIFSTPILSLFFFTCTATTEIYTLSLHDALPIFAKGGETPVRCRGVIHPAERAIGPRRAGMLHQPLGRAYDEPRAAARSEEHTSELQSRFDLVCRLLLEKKKKKYPLNYSLLTYLL